MSFLLLFLMRFLHGKQIDTHDNGYEYVNQVTYPPILENFRFDKKKDANERNGHQWFNDFASGQYQAVKFQGRHPKFNAIDMDTFNIFKYDITKQHRSQLIDDLNVKRDELMNREDLQPEVYDRLNEEIDKLVFDLRDPTSVAPWRFTKKRPKQVVLTLTTMPQIDDMEDVWMQFYKEHVIDYNVFDRPYPKDTCIEQTCLMRIATNKPLKIYIDGDAHETNKEGLHLFDEIDVDRNTQSICVEIEVDKLSLKIPNFSVLGVWSTLAKLRSDERWTARSSESSMVDLWCRGDSDAYDWKQAVVAHQNMFRSGDKYLKYNEDFPIFLNYISNPIENAMPFTTFRLHLAETEDVVEYTLVHQVLTLDEDNMHRLFNKSAPRTSSGPTTPTTTPPDLYASKLTAYYQAYVYIYIGVTCVFCVFVILIIVQGLKGYCSMKDWKKKEKDILRKEVDFEMNMNKSNRKLIPRKLMDRKWMNRKLMDRKLMSRKLMNRKWMNRKLMMAEERGTEMSRNEKRKNRKRKRSIFVALNWIRKLNRRE